MKNGDSPPPHIWGRRIFEQNLLFTTTVEILHVFKKISPLKILYVFSKKIHHWKYCMYVNLTFAPPLSIWGRRIFVKKLPPNQRGGGAKLRLKTWNTFSGEIYWKTYNIFSGEKRKSPRRGPKTQIEKHAIFSVVKFCWKTYNIFSDENFLKTCNIFSDENFKNFLENMQYFLVKSNFFQKSSAPKKCVCVCRGGGKTQI